MWEFLTWTKACFMIDEPKIHILLDSTNDLSLRHTISTMGLQS